MLDTADMTEVHAYAKEILAKCQLPDCVIVSLGTTNALIDAFLRYYLKDEADRAMHYVPVRGLSFLATNPIWQRRVLPSGAKRAVLVRTLESGMTVQRLALKMTEAFGDAGPPLAIEGYFMVARKFELVRDFLQGGDGYFGPGGPFPWPYEVRKLTRLDAIAGSYREFDADYYRYRYLRPSGSYTFWKEKTHLPAIQELRREIARSVGADSSTGPKLLEMTPALERLWGQSIDTYGNVEDAITNFALDLPYERHATGNPERKFWYRLEAIVNGYYSSPEFHFEENPAHLVLDRAVADFIADRSAFEKRQCEAAATATPVLRVSAP